MPEIGTVKTKGEIDALSGSPISREMILTIEGIESMKQEKEILSEVKKLLVKLSGQGSLD